MAFPKQILQRMIRYRLSRLGWMRPGTPFNLTYSVTNLCQSRCRTCKIWELYRENPEKRQEELTTEEIERIFRTMGRIFIFNVSGGEPFLRSDIVDIVRLACQHLRPGVIHIPTNAIAMGRVEGRVVEILEVVNRFNPSIQVTIKPSLDHIGEKHDEIRGIPGNFEKVMALFKRLKALQPKYPNLHAELGTVISRWNVRDIAEIARFVTALGSDSYRNEIAEQRSEMFNLQDAITPEPSEYEEAIGYFVSEIKGHLKHLSFFQRMTNAFRLVYYDLAIRILKEDRQVIPCYAGVSNAHMSAYGDIWPCCTLGYGRSMGNLRDHDYDFHALWNSPRAEKVRQYIQRPSCACPLANQTYSNILLHGPSLLKTLGTMVRSK